MNTPVLEDETRIPSGLPRDSLNDEYGGGYDRRYRWIIAHSSFQAKDQREKLAPVRRAPQESVSAEASLANEGHRNAEWGILIPSRHQLRLPARISGPACRVQGRFAHDR